MTQLAMYPGKLVKSVIWPRLEESFAFGIEHNNVAVLKEEQHPNTQKDR